MVEVKETPRIKELRYKSRIISIKGGIFAAAKSSFGDYYLSPFAIAINASNSVVALLTSISGLLGPMSQMFGSRLIEKFPRKKVLLKSIFFESLMWIPFIGVALLYWFDVVRSTLAVMFLFFFAFYTLIMNLSNPAWFSWTGDLINEKYRGRWFAKRNLLTGFVSVVLALFASLILDYFTSINLLIFGFIILFSFALVSRIISWRFYSRGYEPKLELKEGDYFSFTSFLIRAKSTNFGRFSFFSALFNLAISISSPLFVIYMLRNLHFNYFVYMLITIAGTVFSLMVMEIWGKIADKIGNYKIICTSGLLMSLVPILWIFSKSPVYFIFVPTLINGIALAGFNLASSNFVYDNVSVEKRGLAISYFNMLSGAGVFLGAAIGAFLITFLKINFMLPILAIFVLSGVLMFVVVIFFIPIMKEVKKSNKGRGFRNVVLRQLRPAVLGEIHEIIHVKKYLRK